jgi:hypothetical protein
VDDPRTFAMKPPLEVSALIIEALSCKITGS